MEASKRLPRKSKRLAGLEPSPMEPARAAKASEAANVSQVLGLSPKKADRRGIMEARALDRGAEAARLRDAQNEAEKRARNERRASAASNASLTWRASQLDWTEETGLVMTDDEGTTAAVLTDVDEDAEDERSLVETPTDSDKDFIVPDSRYEAERDETYVETDDECEDMDESQVLTILLNSGELTPPQERRIIARLSSIRATRAREGEWME